MSANARPKVTSWSAGSGAEVHICGVGARTPLGMDTAASAAAVRGGISAVGEHPFLLDGSRKPIDMACDAELSPSLAAGMDLAQRMTAMLSSAMDEALETASPDLKGQPIPCWIGLPEPRPGLLQDVGRSVLGEISVGFGIEPQDVHALQRGHCAGLMAMQRAASLIAAGRIDLCIAAGVDSYHTRTTLDWLDRTRVLLSGRNRNGFAPGEAASACLLASGPAAHRHRLPVLASITAAATCLEPHPIRGKEVCIGAGLSAVVNDVIAVLQRQQKPVTATYCDLNGERYRSEEFLYALLRTQHGFLDANDYLSPADCWGDVGAASGPLFSCLAVESMRGGYAKGANPILWAGSETGYRTALILNLMQPTI